MQIENEKPEEGLEPFVVGFLQSRLNELLGLLKNPEINQIQKLAHNWKGYSRPYGFIGLEDLAVKIDLHAKNNEIEQCKNLLKDVQKYLNLKKEFLSK